MTIKTAIDVEELVRWTYQVQRADMIVGAGIELYESEALVDGVGGVFGGGGDSCTRVRSAGILGCKVDGGGFNRGDLHPDAEAVHDAVMEMILNARSAGLLVLQFGVAGLHPDWREGAHPRWEPCQTRQRPDGERAPVYKCNAGVVHDAVTQATFKACATIATAPRRRKRTAGGDMPLRLLPARKRRPWGSFRVGSRGIGKTFFVLRRPTTRASRLTTFARKVELGSDAVKGRKRQPASIREAKGNPGKRARKGSTKTKPPKSEGPG